MGFDLNPCYHLISTSAKPKMDDLNPGYLDMVIIGKTRKSMKGMTKIVLKGASDNCIISVEAWHICLGSISRLGKSSN